MINLATPYVTDKMRSAVQDVLQTRFIGQGPRVDEFEEIFQQKLGTLPAVAVGSGTDALHISYILAGLKAGDEVLVPNFTCTATNLPLIWLGCKLVFVDIQKNTLNIDPEDLKRKITKDTKAVVTVDYAGLPCDYTEISAIAGNIPIIADCAHSVGATYDGVPVGNLGNFNTFSFQAIKHITTGDGGMITMNEDFVERAKLIRWFGIDRKKKLTESIWKNDITEIGYKYQMTDISASMGIASIQDLDFQLNKRKVMSDAYRDGLKDITQVTLLEETPNRTSAHWLMTILVEDRDALQKYLNENQIESSPMHYRNDQYSIFKKFKNDCPNMDKVEKKILCLPFHMNLSKQEIETVINTIKKYYE